MVEICFKTYYVPPVVGVVKCIDLFQWIRATVL